MHRESRKKLPLSGDEVSLTGTLKKRRRLKEQNDNSSLSGTLRVGLNQFFFDFYSKLKQFSKKIFEKISSSEFK